MKYVQNFKILLSTIPYQYSHKNLKSIPQSRLRTGYLQNREAGKEYFYLEVEIQHFQRLHISVDNS